MTRSIALVVFAAALLPTGIAGAAASSASRILFSADRAPLVSGEVYRVGADRRRVDLSRSPWNDALPVSSPDGRRVAFVSDRSGSAAVYTVARTGRGLRLVVRARSQEPGRTLYAWSPDGSTLAVVALDDGQQTLAKGLFYVVHDGRTRKLASVGDAQGLAWTPDGRFVTYHDGFSLVGHDPDTGRIAWQVPLQAASTAWTPRGLLAGDDGNGHVVVVDQSGRVRARFAGSGASWSPDGRFLVSVHGGGIEIRDAGLALRRRVAVAGLGHGVVPLWMRPHVVFVPAADTSYDIDVTTGRAQRDDGPWPLFTGRAGSTFAWVTRAGTGFAVWVQRAGGPSRRVAELDGCHDDGSFIPAFDQLSPAADGSSVAYASRCYEPFGNLYSLDGSQLRRLTTAAAEQIEPSASPRGDRIAYAQAPAVGLSCKGCPVTIWVASADGSHATEVTHTTDSFDNDPSWSPDGATILFSRSDPSSFGRLYTVPASGGAITPLNIAGAAPAWGPARIAYVGVTAKGNGVWTARPDGSDAEQIYRGADLAAPAWSHDGRLAFLVGPRAVGIWDGTRVRLVRMSFGSIGSVAWSPDGTQLVVSARAWGTPAADVYLVRTDGTHPRRLTTNMNAVDVSWN